MKNNSNKNKFSISATLRLMRKGQSFVVPVNGQKIANIYAMAHTGAKQMDATVSARHETHKGGKEFVRVFLTEEPSKGNAKIPYPIESGIKMAAAKSGRPVGSTNKPKKAAESKAKAAKPVAKKNVKTAKAVLTPAK